MLIFLIALLAGFACLAWPRDVFDTPLAMLTLGVIGQLLLSALLFCAACYLLTLPISKPNASQNGSMPFPVEFDFSTNMAGAAVVPWDGWHQGVDG